jgi:hypothetical protein
MTNSRLQYQKCEKYNFLKLMLHRALYFAQNNTNESWNPVAVFCISGLIILTDVFSSVGIATSYGLDDQGVGVRVLVG